MVIAAPQFEERTEWNERIHNQNEYHDHCTYCDKRFAYRSVSDQYALAGGLSA